jgi:hypothetical protein
MRNSSDTKITVSTSFITINARSYLAVKAFSRLFIIYVQHCSIADHTVYEVLAHDDAIQCSSLVETACHILGDNRAL